MPGDRCCVCGNTRAKDTSVSLHRFPTDSSRRQQWLRAFNLEEDSIKPHSRVCSRHFPAGDVACNPNPLLGKRFASPKKGWTPQAKRAKCREQTKKQLAYSNPPSRSPTPTSRPASISTSEAESVSPLIASVGEPLLSDHQVHELYSDSDSLASEAFSASAAVTRTEPSSSTVTVNTALLARVEFLEAENQQLKEKVKQLSLKRKTFCIKHIAHDDKLVRFYTGFCSYMVLLAFFEFLEPSVNELNYWGRKKKPREQKRRRPTKLTPLNQLFMTLMKLRLNLPVCDLAFRFMVSKSLTSTYITTWICFLYQHLKEITWMPSVEQVLGTMPSSFREKYPTTFAIIDGSEVFIETPSDLQLQSSTWSNYKHHNTAKFLVACTPNGSISYISSLYVGSISDVEITRHSEFLQKLEGKHGISVMADRGFTIKDMLEKIGVELNIPPFMEGRQQLPHEEIKEGRTIASLRIHVERAIGRMKNFRILKDTFPISMSRLANQVVCVCGWLTNFQPALVPIPDLPEEDEADDYFRALDSEYDGDESGSDSDDST